jgi:cytochrome d ubiquinol oxidase subunit I
VIGGLPDPETGRIRFGLVVPGGLSFLVTHRFDAVISGLDDVPEDERPNVLVTHLAFEIMVGSGMALGAISAWFWARRVILRRREPSRLFLRAVALASPLGFLALEAGWVVTEAGRQPWTIHKILRTRDAVTPSPSVIGTFLLFTFLYIALGVAVVVLLRHLAAHHEEGAHAA